MKFNCGPTWEEKKAALEQWHPWFAWKPVRVGKRDCRWLETVNRKGTYKHSLYCNPWSWEYKVLEGK